MTHLMEQAANREIAAWGERNERTLKCKKTTETEVTFLHKNPRYATGQAHIQ